MNGKKKKEKQVLDSLKNSKYLWRSVEGIAKENNLAQMEVNSQIANLKRKGLIIESSRRDKKGRELYALKEKYFSKKNIFSRIISALADEVK